MDNQRGKTNNETKQLQFAYIAGLVDGEGCVSANRTPAKSYGRKYFRYVPRVTITNTNIPLLRYLEKVFEENNIAFHVQWRTIKQLEKQGQKVRKDIYNIAFYGAKRVKRLLTPVLPYLVVKAPQAAIMYDFCNHIIGRPRGSWGSQEERIKTAKLREQADLQTSLLIKKLNGNKFNDPNTLLVSPETVRQAHSLYVKSQSELQ
ncbi:MAG TPA: hypothetical protein ENI23_08495 [bacterium]|nr:hypothetical protein [bacterium]